MESLPCRSMSDNGSNTETQFDIFETEWMMHEKGTPILHNRCWFTVAKVIHHFPKKDRHHFVFVEGHCDGNWHCWMEVDGVSFDPHFDELCRNDSATENRSGHFVAKKKWKGESVLFAKGDDNKETRWGFRVGRPLPRGHFEAPFTCRDLQWDNLEPTDNWDNLECSH